MTRWTGQVLDSPYIRFRSPHPQSYIITCEYHSPPTLMSANEAIQRLITRKHCNTWACLRTTYNRTQSKSKGHRSLPFSVIVLFFLSNLTFFYYYCIKVVYLGVHYGFFLLRLDVTMAWMSRIEIWGRSEYMLQFSLGNYSYYFNQIINKSLQQDSLQKKNHFYMCCIWPVQKYTATHKTQSKSKGHRSLPFSLIVSFFSF